MHIYAYMGTILESRWRTSCKYAQISPTNCQTIAVHISMVTFISLIVSPTTFDEVPNQFVEVSGLIDNGEAPKQRGRSASCVINHWKEEIRHKSQLLLRNLRLVLSVPK